jgi:integrase
MRFGEMAGLHVEDLGFSELIVHIRRSTVIHREASPNSNAGHREVNVNASHILVIVYRAERSGTPLVNGNVNRYVLKSLCKEIGTPVSTTHAFRHGRVSVLQQNGVPGDLIKR